MALVTDVAGLRSSADAGAWDGVRQTAAQVPCLQPELITPSRPSEYGRNLRVALRQHDDLVIGGSFLLSDAVVDAARSNPETHFVLVDPLVPPPGLPNLTVLVFRRDQAAFLAGALAAMVTQTDVIAGVYGPGGSLDEQNRFAFERGAHFVGPGIQVLGAYQPATEGSPYANPAWGNAQARAFVDEHADVIFGAGGSTAEGALLAAAQTGHACIGGDIDARMYPPAASCLLASTRTFFDKGVELEVMRAAAGQWAIGELSVGLVEGAVGLSLPAGPRVSPAVRQRLAAIESGLAAGRLTTGS